MGIAPGLPPLPLGAGPLLLELEPLLFKGPGSKNYSSDPEPLFSDPGPLLLDPGPLLLDPGPLLLDPGPLHSDPGPLLLDPGPLLPGPRTFTFGRKSKGSAAIPPCPWLSPLALGP